VPVERYARLVTNNWQFLISFLQRLIIKPIVRMVPNKFSYLNLTITQSRLHSDSRLLPRQESVAVSGCDNSDSEGETDNSQ